MTLIDPSSVGMALSNAQSERISSLKASQFFKFDPLDHCFACGGADFDLLADNDRYGFALNYCACKNCGFAFANPYYTDNCLEAFYTRHYALIYGRAGSERQVFEGEYLNASDLIWPMVRHHVASGRSVLDFGCAYGGSLVAFPTNWRRVGFDFDEQQLAYGRQFGLDLRDIRKINSLKEQFDVVMLNQVLEHTKDPITLLKRVHPLLSEAGILYVEVPGFETVFQENFDPRLIFKNAHRHFFCLDSLSRVASLAGFELVEGFESVRAVFRKRTSALTTTHEIPKTVTPRTSEKWVEQLVAYQPSRTNCSRSLLKKIWAKIRRWTKKRLMWQMLARR